MNYKLILTDGFKPEPLPGRDEWIAALRSGKYKQGRTKLRLGDMYCCLGVKCELDKRPVKNQNGSLPTMFDGLESCIATANPIYSILDGMGDFPLGAKVEHWHDGEEYNDDSVFVSRNLAGCNDRGFTFAQIADIIEQLWTNA